MRPPLVWNTHPDEEDYFSARPAQGRLYCVEADDHVWTATTYNYAGCAVVDVPLGNHETEAAAKAAAERHWQQQGGDHGE